MGMQTAISILNFLAAHKLALVNLLGLAAVYALIQLWAWFAYGPKDTTGNGITIGPAKAFDNRSLALRIERLSSRLASLNVVNPNLTENLSAFQQQTASQSTSSVNVDVKASPAQSSAATTPRQSSDDKKAAPESAAAVEGAKADPKATVALAASDVLNDQLNLASQILNLETLYERSLTDRLFGSEPRLQTVLGFQVSITPPRGCEDSVAVVEIGVRMKPNVPKETEHPVESHYHHDSLVRMEQYGPKKTEPRVDTRDNRVSLVALIPHEKTYNSQTVSTSSQSIGGSAVASVITLGFTSKGETRQLFVHRDSDTIAFERDSRAQPTLFDNDSSATVFGWEFRPVLGRKTVSPGTRQMLAVIAMPEAEKDAEDRAALEISTRSYWRHLNQRRQTSSRKWSWLPLDIDQSKRTDFPSHYLEVPNTAQIQAALEPKVKHISWVTSGTDEATVMIRGSNFFSGTKVLIGRDVLSEENDTLTLKSNQALEFKTSLTSLAAGDCVISGRFGSSVRLSVDQKKEVSVEQKKKAQALSIVRAAIEATNYNNTVYLKIDVNGIDADGDQTDFEIADIQKLPEPILYVGANAVPLPYDYFDMPPPGQPDGAKESGDQAKPDDEHVEAESVQAPHATGGAGNDHQAESHTARNDPKEQKPQPSSADPKPSGADAPAKKYIQVGAWIPKALAASQSVSFRVPFCGLEYQTSFPLIYSEPNVMRIGGDDDKCVFRIASPSGFQEPFSVELDKSYTVGVELVKKGQGDYAFTISKKLAAQYPYLVIRTGSAQP